MEALACSILEPPPSHTTLSSLHLPSPIVFPVRWVRREAAVHRSSEDFIKCNSSLWLTETLALIGRSVHEDFGGDDVAERQEHLHELRVPELLGQVVNKQVATFWP